MKTRILLLAALLCFAGITQAQTNPPPSFSGGIQQIADAIGLAPWTAVFGAGRASTGNRNLAFGAVAYNFNQNVGAVIGVDRLWAPHQDVQQQDNALKGGLTLSAPIHPFAFLGSSFAFATNVVGTPFVSALIATPTGGSSDSVATIATVGINFDLASWKGFTLGAGGQVETRSGSGYWNGTYYLADLNISKGGGAASLYAANDRYLEYAQANLAPAFDR